MTRLGYRAAATLLALLIPVASAAQQTDSISPARASLTVGMGVLYGGLLGAVGEVYLAQSRFSALVGAGRSSGGWTCGCAGVSAGLRRYRGGSSSRFYLDATGLYVFSDGESEGLRPAALVGYANVEPSGFTVNAAFGIARSAEGSAIPTVNLGLGYTWGGHPPSRSP